MAVLSGNYAALAQRDFRRFWTGSTTATTAFMMSFMLVPSVAFSLTGKNSSAGMAQFGSGIAMTAISPIGGVIADRMRKKPIVFAGQAIPALVILITGVLITSDVITVPLLTAATLIMGLGFSFMGPARQAWVGELVPREMFPNAIALQQIAQNVSQVAAPLLIALLVGTDVLTLGQAYLFMASLFAIVLPITASLPNTSPAAKEQRSVLVELGAGLRYVWSRPRLRTLWLGFMGMVVCGFAFQTLLPGLLEELGHESTDVGPIFLAMAVAGLCTTLPLAGVVKSRLAWPILLGAGAVMAVGLLLVARAPGYAVAMVVGIPLGMGRSAFMLIDNSLLMSNAEPAYHGRVMSLAMMGFGSQALLAPLWGFTADRAGVSTALLTAGIAAASIIAVMAFTWLRLRRDAHVADRPLAATAAG
jgi:MFS family permease